MELKTPSQTSTHPLLNLNIQHRHDLGVLTNRVNYIIRKHEKTKNSFNNTKLQAFTTQASDFHNKNSIFSINQQSSIIKQSNKLRTLHAKVNQFVEDSIIPLDKSSRQLSLETKQRRYQQLKHQSLINNKLIKQQKQQSFLTNKANKLKVLKSYRAGRENVSDFWETKRKDFQTLRQIKNLPHQISEVKIQELKLRILKAEEESLDKFEQLICHQEQLAFRIKSKLNIL